jgi:hypothetical protein
MTLPSSDLDYGGGSNKNLNDTISTVSTSDNRHPYPGKLIHDQAIECLQGAQGLPLIEPSHETTQTECLIDT